MTRDNWLAGLLALRQAQENGVELVDLDETIRLHIEKCCHWSTGLDTICKESDELIVMARCTDCGRYGTLDELMEECNERIDLT